MKYQTSTKSTALARLSLTAQHLHLSRCSSTSATPDIIPINQGTKFTPDYTNYATTPNRKIVSYFHDIALNLNKETREANMVVEIPRWTNAKFEINTKTPGNPIVQDIKKGEYVLLKTCFLIMDIFTIMEHFLKHGKTQQQSIMVFLVIMILWMFAKLDPKFYQLVMLKE